VLFAHRAVVFWKFGVNGSLFQYLRRSLSQEPQEIENHDNPQQGDQQKQGKTNNQVSIQNGTGARITDPYLQRYADYDRESKEEGVFQEQLSPQGRIFDKNSRRGR